MCNTFFEIFANTVLKCVLAGLILANNYVLTQRYVFPPSSLKGYPSQKEF